MCVLCLCVWTCVYVCACMFCVCIYVYVCMFCVCTCVYVCACMFCVCICSFMCLCAGVVLCVEVKDHSLSLETRERGLFSKHQMMSSHQMWVYTEKSPQILPPSLKRKCFRLAENPEPTKWGWGQRLPPHWAPRFEWVQLPPEGFPGGSAGRESTCIEGDLGLIPGLGRSPGEAKGYPLQYSGLENPWTEEPGRLQSMGWQRVGHDWVTFIFTFHQINKNKIYLNTFIFQYPMSLLRFFSHIFPLQLQSC